MKVKTEMFLFQVGIYTFLLFGTRRWCQNADNKITQKLLLWLIEYLMSYRNETVKH